MVETPTKKQYVAPKLREHGVVRELTQGGSGSNRGMSMGMGMSGFGMSMGM
jgi:hypothetical protein